jgi:hypothetical protein
MFFKVLFIIPYAIRCLALSGRLTGHTHENRKYTVCHSFLLIEVGKDREGYSKELSHAHIIWNGNASLLYQRKLVAEFASLVEI